ncbi:MAG: phosphoribosylamine--glycine ligase [Pseudomonadota bacterium]|nr:phosphoribosylamine--glycine ligase [Pseudomonadota bacterium]
MKILVIGSGGREHALAWRIAQSPRVSRVLVSPGNGGTAAQDGMINVPGHTVADWLRIARDENVHLTVVGPEAPLAEGVVDAFRAAGLRIFGPTRAAAQLEGSKDFAKQFMLRHGIPTARSATFDNAAAAHACIEREGAPVVIKADGLAAGKGVVVATTTAEAHQAVDDMLGGSLGGAGHRVLIEQFLSGEEASFIVMVDGQHVLALASSQDHKRLLDGDQGPNTGGMGAYSPAPVVTPAMHGRIMREIILPTVAGMAAEGVSYTGFLYAGVMIDPDGHPQTLEFNCRMGDPETQPIMMRLKSDFTVLLDHAVAGTLDQVEAEWDRRCAVGVVMAAHGYPGTPRRGDAISGLDEKAADVEVFHAGTALADGRVVTAGGRVLCVTALADNVRQARQRAYERAERIHFEGRQMRSDIGWRALAHPRG